MPCLTDPIAHPLKLKRRIQRREKRPNTERLEGPMSHIALLPRDNPEESLTILEHATLEICATPYMLPPIGAVVASRW